MSPLAPVQRPAPGPEAALRLAAALEATAPRPAGTADDPSGGGLLPVPEALAPLIPGGAPARGSVTEAGDAGLLWTLAGAAARDVEQAPEHRWIAVVGMPEAGLLALTEAGVDPDRLLLVDHPGPQKWADVVTALAGAVDVLVVRPPVPVAAETARRLGAHLRRGRATLLTPTPWPGSTLRLTVEAGSWLGLGQGHGLLHSRQVVVEATGRGRAGGPGRSVRAWMPDQDGLVRPVRADEQQLPGRQEQRPASLVSLGAAAGR